MRLHSFFTFLKATGTKIIRAINHLQKARVTGGIQLGTPLAIIKLPDQIRQVINAKQTAVKYFFLHVSFIR